MHKSMQAYLDGIAEDLGTTMIQQKDMPGMMFVEYEPPRIEGPLLAQKDSWNYPDLTSRFMVMLHELGHVYHGHTQGRPPYSDQTFYFDNGVLRSEAQAWEFALDNFDTFIGLFGDSGLVLSELCRKFMWERCLGSYYSGYKTRKGQPYRLSNGNRHHVEFIFDEPDDFFWSIKERILNG